MQLYTISYDKLTKVSTFDQRGNKTGERVERLRLSMHALPLQTARMYQSMMTDHNFTMEPYVSGDEKPSYTHRKQSAAKKQAARPAKSKQSAQNEAARTGDLSAAINEGE